jgi:hypothetical protein
VRNTSLQVVAAVYVEGDDLHRSCCDCLCGPLQVRRRLPNRRLREGGQLSRLCAVADPLVEVVYVSPCVLPETVMAYYRKMIEVGEVQLPLFVQFRPMGAVLLPMPHGRLCLRWFLVVATQVSAGASAVARFKVVVPENIGRLPPTLSLSSCLLYVEQALPIASETACSVPAGCDQLFSCS